MFKLIRSIEEFQQIIEEASKLKNTNFDGIAVAVRGEGPHPHLHFFKNADDISKDTGGCIMLKIPEYFIHGPHRDTLNSREQKEFVKFINSIGKKTGKVMWYVLKDLWNKGVPNKEFVFQNSVKMPDYTQLPTTGQLKLGNLNSVKIK